MKDELNRLTRILVIDDAGVGVEAVPGGMMGPGHRGPHYSTLIQPPVSP
jgi:hypothetical protein